MTYQHEQLQPPFFSHSLPPKFETTRLKLKLLALLDEYYALHQWKHCYVIAEVYTAQIVQFNPYLMMTTFPKITL